MTERIAVLDHGYVALVDHMGDDLSVVRSARASYDSAWRAGTDKGSDERLIRYLWRNRHTSPFEAVEFQFEVRAPIFVLRQWMRHRTWSYNEISARYRPLPEMFYVPDASIVGKQSSDNKQGRDIEGGEDCLVPSIIDYACKAAFETYRTLLEHGAPREVARLVLPLSTYSVVFAKCDLHNLMHFLTLRLHPHAQYEIQQYARAITQIIEPIVPVCMAAWHEMTDPELRKAA